MLEPSEEQIASTEGEEATANKECEPEINHNEDQPNGEIVDVVQEKPDTRLLELAAEVEQLKREQDAFRTDQELILQERNASRKEVAELKELLAKNEEQNNQRMAKLRSDYETRIQKIEKERDSMVVKYARSEREVITAQNQRETAEKKAKELAKERDVLLEKIKGLNAEKTKVCHMLEAKCNEYFSSQREIDRMKDEINQREVKVRWAQNKLKSETESHQETQSKYEKCIVQMKQLKEELEEFKRTYNEMRIREHDNKAHNEAQLLEEKARLIMEKQNLEEQSNSYKNALKDFEGMKTRHTQLVEENSSLLAKLQNIQKERSEQEQAITQLKEQVTQQREALIQAQTKLAEMGGVQIQLERERERMTSHQEELEAIKQSNSDLLQDMKRCQEKETELLVFTQRLTEKNVLLQSEVTGLHERMKELETTGKENEAKLEQLELKCKHYERELQNEKENRDSESTGWSKSVSEKSRLCEDLQTQVRELQNELASVRRKHAANMKEMTRELRIAKKRIEQFETSSIAGGSNSNDHVSLGSRTSSNTSINTAGMEHQSPEHSPSPPPAVQMTHDWERNAILDKMVRIQRENAKKSEKIDFLEEHVKDLVSEIKKKNKLLQYFMAKEESGSMASEASDRHKAELAKHGGIMSSMYNHKTLDDGLSLELCLEINQKLQNTLEDTLLKNITLKENLNTLGAEVAKISQKYQALLQQSRQGK